jgi:hypothetical protein
MGMVKETVTTKSWELCSMRSRLFSIADVMEFQISEAYPSLDITTKIKNYMYSIIRAMRKRRLCRKLDQTNKYADKI